MIYQVHCIVAGYHGASCSCGFRHTPDPSLLPLWRHHGAPVLCVPVIIITSPTYPPHPANAASSTDPPHSSYDPEKCGGAQSVDDRRKNPARMCLRIVVCLLLLHFNDSTLLALRPALCASLRPKCDYNDLCKAHDTPSSPPPLCVGARPLVTETGAEA
jgi:hypothetical protein